MWQHEKRASFTKRTVYAKALKQTLFGEVKEEQERKCFQSRVGTYLSIMGWYQGGTIKPGHVGHQELNTEAL